MENQEFKCELCEYVGHRPMGFSNHIQYKHVDSGDISSTEEYYLKYLGEKTYCQTCGKETEFKSVYKKYKPFCCHKCSMNHPITKKERLEKASAAFRERCKNKDFLEDLDKKKKATRKKHFGDENYYDKEKRKKTCLEKYGVESPRKTKKVQDKYKKTCLEKYGVENPLQSEEIKKKIKNTCLEKYGVEHIGYSKEAKHKAAKTNMERYGGTLKGSKETAEKIKKTMLEKYGVEVSMQNEELQKKARKTNLERYGKASLLEGNEYSKDKGIVEKQKVNRKKALQEKYGVDNISQLRSTQETIKKNNLERYGVENTTHIPEVRKKQIENRSDWLKHKKYITYFGNEVSYQTKMELRFLKDCDERRIFVENGDHVDYVFNNKKKRYFVDFRIKVGDRYQLVEIKGSHIWYYKSVESGVSAAKIEAAERHSEKMGYLPYKFLLDYDGEF